MDAGMIISQVVNILLIVIGIAVTGVIIFIVYQEKKYCNQATIKDCVNGGKINIRDKFKVKKERDGTIWWRLKKLRVSLPPQPNEVTEITNKGKLSATWYRLEGDTYVPCKDSFDPQHKTAREDIISQAKPYTTNQRSMMVNQHVKGIRDKKTSLISLLEKAIAPVAMVLLVVCVMIFWGEFIAPMNEGATVLAGQMETISENLVEASGKLDAAINNRVSAELAINNNNNFSGVPD